VCSSQTALRFQTDDTLAFSAVRNEILAYYLQKLTKH